MWLRLSATYGVSPPTAPASWQTSSSTSGTFPGAKVPIGNSTGSSGTPSRDRPSSAPAPTAAAS